MLGGLEETSLQESERLLRRSVELEPESLLARYELALTLLAAEQGRGGRRGADWSAGDRTSEAADAIRQLDAAARLSRLSRSAS